MREILISYFICFTFFPVIGQDIYNPDLIKELNVKNKKVVISGSINDTTEYQYDNKGRLVFKKDKKYGEGYIDSIFYEKQVEISKEYTTNGILKNTTKKVYDKNGNIIKFERNQFLPIVDNSGYESIYKNGEIVSSKMFRNGEIISTWNKKSENKNDSIIYYENDSTYSYLLNNSELIDFYEEDGKFKKEMGMLAFDDQGKIVWSTNYVHNKPNEVSIIVRKYDNESKTFTEIINKEYYYSNGLQKRKEDNEHGMIITYFYEFY